MHIYDFQTFLRADMDHARCHAQFNSDRELVDANTKQGARYFKKLRKSAVKSKRSTQQAQYDHEDLIVAETKQREELQLVSNQTRLIH
jgi:hypothetical protein